MKQHFLLLCKNRHCVHRCNLTIIFKGIMLWILSEGAYIAGGFCRILLLWLAERCKLVRNGEPQPEISDLLSTTVMSKLLQLPVASVAVDQEKQVCLGAGGTGTSRVPLRVELISGKVLHLFVKFPTSALAERAFLSLFQVYDNEIRFYAKLHKDFCAALGKPNWRVGPEVYHAK